VRSTVLPDGRRVHKTIGPAWTQRGRPAAGTFTKRTADAWLRDVLSEARRGTLPGLTKTGVTFAAACDDYLAHKEADRRLKPTTLRDYASIIKAHLVPALGDLAVEDLTTDMVEDWKLTLNMSNTTKIKILTVLFGVMERARKRHRLPVNPIRDVEKPRQDHSPGGELQFYSTEEVLALVRAAADEQDAAIFLTAAFTGLRRRELVALRWRDVDFPNATIRVSASFSEGHLTRPKSGKVRAVPMAPDVATALARLGQRERWTSDDDRVFTYATARSWTRRRCTAASSPRPRAPGWVGCASTTCATRSARRWRPTRASTCAACRSGWATPTRRRRSATRTSPRATTTPSSWRRRSRSTPRADGLLRDPLPEQLLVEERSPADLQERDPPVARELVDRRARHAQDPRDLVSGQ
jgi:integrase